MYSNYYIYRYYNKIINEITKTKINIINIIHLNVDIHIFFNKKYALHIPKNVNVILNDELNDSKEVG